MVKTCKYTLYINIDLNMSQIMEVYIEWKTEHSKSVGRVPKKIKSSNLSYVTFQENIEIGSHKTSGY